MTTTINGYEVTISRQKHNVLCNVSKRSYQGALHWLLDTKTLINPRGKQSPVDPITISLILQWAKTNGY